MDKDTGRERGAMERTEAMPLVLRDDEIVARYGPHLSDETLSEAQHRESLVALFHVMRTFVDFGFSAKAGDKIIEGSELGLDDVLRYIFQEKIAQQELSQEEVSGDAKGE